MHLVFLKAFDIAFIGLVSQQSSERLPLLMWSDGSVVSRYAGFWALKQPNFATGACAQMLLTEKNGVHHTNAWSLGVCNTLQNFACELPSCIKGMLWCSPE